MSALNHVGIGQRCSSYLPVQMTLQHVAPPRDGAMGRGKGAGGRGKGAWGGGRGQGKQGGRETGGRGQGGRGPGAEGRGQFGFKADDIP
jgi:hypothetical protein